MKRFHIAILALAVASVSCNKMEEIENPTENLPDIEVADGQLLCAIPQTKTALDGLNVVWSEEDEIMVFGEENRTAVYKFSSFVSEDSKTTAIFENVDPSVKGNRSAVYPASAYVKDSYNGTTAQISLGGVDDVTLSSGTPDEVLAKTVVSSLPLVSTPSEETLSFANLFGGVMFRPYDYMGSGIQIRKIRISSTDGKALAGVATINLSDGKITAFEGTETELTFTYNATSITSDKGFIAYIPAGTYDGLTITAIDASDRKFPVTTGAVTVNAGVVKKLSQLPLTIYYGKANCYRVAPGTTSLEIDATPFYTYRSDYDVTKGQVIRCENGNMSGLGADVFVLWQQEEGSTATDLTLTRGTSKEADGAVVKGTLAIDRKFQAGEATITVPLTGTAGNAVIALCTGDDSKKIVWSYHIWVSDAEDVACSTSAGTYSILDRNIGATSTDGTLNSFGVNYQWGRKDPFPRNLSTGQGELLNTIERPSTVNYAYVTAHPDTRIVVTSSTTTSNWLTSGANTAAWGAAGGSQGSTAGARGIASTVKTVYDPCPAGYKVPLFKQLDAFNAINSKANAVAGKGYNVNTGSSTTFIPYSGYVKYHAATDPVVYSTLRGYTWSAVHRNGSQGGYALWMNKDAIAAVGGGGPRDNCFLYAGDAIPVRCVKEENN